MKEKKWKNILNKQKIIIKYKYLYYLIINCLF